MLSSGNQIRLNSNERELFDSLTLIYRTNKSYPKTIEEYNKAFDESIEKVSLHTNAEAKLLIRILEGQKINNFLINL